MKRILTAIVLVPLVVLTIFLGPYWLVNIVAAVVAMLAGWEFLSFASGASARPPRIATLIAIALLFVINYRWPEMLTSAVGVLSLALLVWCAFSSPRERVLGDAAYSVFCLLYTGLTMLALPLLYTSEDGKSTLLFLLCSVWAGDIAAMYVGQAIGRHKMAPHLSPNKTWEGAFGSVLGSLAITGLLYGLASELNGHDLNMLLYPGSILRWLGLCVLVNVAAQVGDLVESALKRSVGVKDSGTLLPGHGGMLDRVDALLLAAPVLWYAQVIQRF